MLRKTTLAGIYQICNLENRKRYIGSSSDINKRWTIHKYYLRKNTHPNKHLQNSWNKHGEKNFIFETIEVLHDAMQLVEREQYYINQHNSNDREFGYNLRKVSKSNLGIKMPEWFRHFAKTIRKGAKHTEESKRKMSVAHTGKILSEEHRKNIGNARRGCIHTSEVKQKISEAHKGKKLSQATKEKISRKRKKLGIAKGKNNYFYGKSGEDSPVAKLTWNKVIKIRQSHSTVKELAKKYSVHENTIRSILRNETWRIDVKQKDTN